MKNDAIKMIQNFLVQKVWNFKYSEKTCIHIRNIDSDLVKHLIRITDKTKYTT